VQAVVLLAYVLDDPVFGVVSPTVGLAVRAHFASYFMTQKSDVEYVVLPGTTMNPTGQGVVSLVVVGGMLAFTFATDVPLVAYSEKSAVLTESGWYVSVVPVDALRQ
jgi:hypothetical protein